MANLDTKESKLILDGTPSEHQTWLQKISSRREQLRPDQDQRRPMYRMRFDFYRGDQTAYTTIVNLRQKEKKGHANAVINYAGKTGVKIGYAMANNPPNYIVTPRKVPNDYVAIERARAQATEELLDDVFTLNHFWKGGYRRASWNQVIAADAAVKVYPCNVGSKDEPEWEFKIVNYEKMENLLIGWRSDDPTRFDYVICVEQRSAQSIYEEFGIKVPEKLTKKPDINEQDAGKTSSHNSNGQWGTTPTGSSKTLLPTGETNIPTTEVIEYDDSEVYALVIANELVELVIKDGVSAPKMQFWVHIPNIPNPNSPWSISDIDFLIDPQTELNEASNEERDYIRVGANQKYVAYNMDDFDPNTIKPGSGGVIFVSSPDGSARFEPLQTNVNSFPVDQYLERMRNHIHDLGLPRVTYGSVGGDSGRAKAVDYQTMVDLVIFKRDSWELALDLLAEKIQRLAWFYLGKPEFLTDPITNKFVVRHLEFDWSDIVPITQGDKVVNVMNKYQMGLPTRQILKELGYRDVDAIIDEMRREAQDPDLMTLRSRMWNVAPGIVEAQKEAQMEMMGGMQTDMNAPTMPASAVNQPSPMLNTSQNAGRETSLPMSARGGTTSYTSAGGQVAQTRQNAQAKGR